MKQYFQSHLVTTLQPWWVILLLCWLTRGRNNSCEGCSSIGYELWACARRVVDWRYDASKWMRRNNRKCVQIKHCSFFTWHLCMHTICLVWRTWPKYAMCSFCFLISNNTELALTLGCERKLFLPGQQNTKQAQTCILPKPLYHILSVSFDLLAWLRIVQLKSSKLPLARISPAL